MLSSDYIKSQIERLIEQEGVLSVRYGATKWSDAHLIEVTPVEIFDSRSFAEFEFSIVDQFEKLFPNEEIIFISNSDIISITNLFYSVTPESISQSLKPVISSNIPKQKFLGLVGQSFNNTDSEDYLLAA